MLDNVDPYKGDIPISPDARCSVLFDDAPRFQGKYSIAIDLGYKTYLTFRPNTGTPSDNIRVTLGRVEWSWTAGAYYDGAWHMNSVCPNPVFYDDDRFPYYENTLVNGLPY